MFRDHVALSFAELPAALREDAMHRFAVLRSHLEENVSLAATAKHADIALRTAQRWLARYRTEGLAGLARMPRSDSGHRRIMSELAQLIEGMALHKPSLSVAAIHRRINGLAKKKNWPTPSYGSVYAIVRGLDPGMVTLALDGHALGMASAHPASSARMWSCRVSAVPPALCVHRRCAAGGWRA
jgi:putative transposase